MDYQIAKQKADEIVALLRPHCDRIEIAGSVRRKKPQVGDIEIVCIPKKDKIQDGFFDMAEVNCKGFCDNIKTIGVISKGDVETGKYIQIQHTAAPENIQLDLFCARADNWGLIFAIRTGSAQYSHHVLAKGWVKRGFHSRNGMLTNSTGAEIPVRSEIDLFRIIGIPVAKPESREFTDVNSSQSEFSKAGGSDTNNAIG